MRRSIITIDNVYSNFLEVTSGALEGTTYTSSDTNGVEYSNVNPGFELMDYFEKFLGHKILNWSGNHSSKYNGSKIKLSNDNMFTETPDSKNWVGFIVIGNNLESIDLIRNGKVTNTLQVKSNRLIMFLDDAQFKWNFTPDSDVAYLHMFLFDWNPGIQLANDYWMMQEWQKSWYRKRLIGNELCDTILKEATEWTKKNEWTKQRHECFPTTDIPLANLPSHDKIVNIIKKEVFPFLEEKFRFSTKYMGINDLFIVKYSSNDQKKLDTHRDISILSFNILLNEASDFEGGGTYFRHANSLVMNEKGHIVIHSGKFFHEGRVVTKGERYIIVGFIQVDDPRINHDIIEQGMKRVVSDEEMIKNLFLY